MDASRFIHPLTKDPLTCDQQGDLHDHNGLVAKNHAGSYDFVLDEHSREERKFYDQTYADGGWWAENTLDSADYDALWKLEPGSRGYLASLGNVSGKSVLLIGNGTSVKEFLFVQRGAHVTFTDLSFPAVLYAKQRYLESKLGRPDACEFHAVNAYHLPFANESFDYVCADAVVHHLDDLTTLFAGIHRVLKPGGICRFADTAYSSLWQGAKKGVLHKLQKRVHEKQGISPEDVKATERGGYTREELLTLAAELGFRDVYYKRVALFDYLLWRTRCKLNMPWVLSVRPVFRAVDRLLSKIGVMESQGISLIFGFNK